MQTKKLCTLVLSATMISTLVVGCGQKHNSKSETSESSTSQSESSSQQEEVILSAVDQKAEFVIVNPILIFLINSSFKYVAL